MAKGDPEETSAHARLPGLAVLHRGEHGNVSVFHRV